MPDRSDWRLLNITDNVSLDHHGTSVSRQLGTRTIAVQAVHCVLDALGKPDARADIHTIKMQMLRQSTNSHRSAFSRSISGDAHEIDEAFNR